MNVRDENFKCVFEMLEQIDALDDSLQDVLRSLRRKTETIRRWMEVEAQLGRETHPPDPTDLELEDPRDDD